MNEMVGLAIGGGIVVAAVVAYTTALRRRSRRLLEREAQLERQIAEHTSALAQSEARLRSFMEHAPDAMFLKGRDGRLLLVNARYGSLVERTPAQMLGNTVHDLVPESRAELYDDHDREVVSTRGAIAREFGSTGPYGAIDLRVTKFPVFGESGEIVAIGGYNTDVTEWRRAEEALRASEARLLSILAASPIGVALARAGSGEIIFANARLYELFRIDENALTMMQSRDFYVDPADATEMSRRLREDGLVHNAELRLRRGDGTEFWALASYAPIEHAGEPARLAWFYDISEQMRVKAELEQSRTNYQGLLDKLPVAVYVNDRADARVLYANPAAIALVGATDASQVVGRSMLDFVHPDTRPEMIERRRRIAAGLPIEPVAEGKYVRIDGSPVEVERAVVPGTYGGEPVDQAVVWDVTSRKRAEAAVRESEARFRDFADTAADFFWELDADYRISYLSGRYEEVFGASPSSVLGNNRLDRVPQDPDDVAKWNEHVADLLARRPFEDFDYRRVRPDGTELVIRASGKPHFDESGAFQGYRGTGRDITEAHAMSERLSHQASHDALTGVLNRREFERRLGRVLETARADGSEHAMCYLDLDLFKVINDSCGHVAGDELLRQLAGVFLAELRKRDTLARLGGDEFGVLMEHCSLDDAERVADGLRAAVEEFRFHWEGKSFAVGISIGLVAIERASGSTADVLSAADSACYAAKDGGRNRVHVFRRDDTELARRYGEMRWVAGINRALDEDRFRLYAQRIVPLAEHSTEGTHFEFLLRMEEEDGSIVAPGVFLPAAERYNLSTRIDRWVVSKALAHVSATRRPQIRRGLYSINLSGRTLGDEHFLSFVLEQLERNGVAPETLCFEVTETSAITNMAAATRFMKELHDSGCRFALDDFGSGLSSFAYLKNLPVDFLKIDGQFVKDIMDDPIDLAMVRSINEIGHVMGLETIAEFVENDAILERLREIGVDYAQGYGVGRPTPVEDPTTSGGHATRQEPTDDAPLTDRRS